MKQLSPYPLFSLVIVGEHSVGYLMPPKVRGTLPDVGILRVRPEHGSPYCPAGPPIPYPTGSAVRPATETDLRAFGMDIPPDFGEKAADDADIHPNEDEREPIDGMTPEARATLARSLAEERAYLEQKHGWRQFVAPNDDRPCYARDWRKGAPGD